MVRSNGLRAAAILGAVLAAAGCASRPRQASESFTFDPPAPRAQAPSAGAILVLGRVDVAPAYAGKAFVYLMGNHRVETDPYAGFAAPPGWLLRSAIRGYLADDVFVLDVVEPGTGLTADAVIEVDALEIAGDLEAEAAAVLTLQFRVQSPPGPRPSVERLLKTYSRRVAVTQRCAPAFAAAWNGALAAIMDEFGADLKAVLAASGPGA
jgi:hypothetical protein